MAQQLLAHAVGFVLFLAVGLLGTFWSRTVQSYEVRLYEMNPLLAASPLREYVISESYLWQVRIVGFVCLLAAGACVHSLLA